MPQIIMLLVQTCHFIFIAYVWLQNKLKSRGPVGPDFKLRAIQPFLWPCRPSRLLNVYPTRRWPNTSSQIHSHMFTLSNVHTFKTLNSAALGKPSWLDFGNTYMHEGNRARVYGRYRRFRIKSSKRVKSTKAETNPPPPQEPKNLLSSGWHPKIFQKKNA